jgi:hypothetical protein
MYEVSRPSRTTLIGELERTDKKIKATEKERKDLTMGQANYWSHATALPGDARSVSKARHFVCSHLVEHLSHLVDDVQLVASE